MGDVALVTVNVRGIRDTLKRRALFRHLHVIYPRHIVCLQETHSIEGDEQRWRSEWGAPLFLAHGRSLNQGGTAILIPNGLVGTIRLINPGRSDRMIILEMKRGGVTFYVVTVYAPNSNRMRDQIEFLKVLEKQLNDLPEASRLFVCGDFNIHRSHLDTSANFVASQATEYMNQMMDRLDLVDVWRYMFPAAKGFTWHRNSHDLTCGSRIDYILVSQATVESQGIAKMEIRPSIRSDHSMLVVHLNLESQKRGPGVWRFNNRLLQSEEFLDVVKKEAGKACGGQDEYENVEDAGLLMELLLSKIRTASIVIGKRIAKEKCKEEKEVLSRIVECIIQTQAGSNKQREYDEYLARWEILQTQKAEKAILFSRARWAEYGEKPTGYFLKMQKRDMEMKVISKLIDSNGVEITGKDGILEECTKYYKEMYTTKQNRELFEDAFHSFVDGLDNPRLTEMERGVCEGEITEIECVQALKSMANGKVPGPSGFTKEFFLACWDSLGPLVVKYINQAYDKGSFFVTQRRGFVSLLPKKGDQRYLKNKRPVILLDIIYKIVAKVIAIRMGKVINGLISTDQTGFLKGRNIGDNLRLMSDVLYFTEKENTPGIIMNMDYSSAFDSIEHMFLFQALRAFNFGDSLIKWVRLLYDRPELTILNNGYTSQWFQPSRAVRQGCPVSGMIFVLAVELFACRLRMRHDINGVRIYGREIKISQYADDTAVFVSNKESASKALDLIHEFGDISGLRLNMSKCDFVWIGKYRKKDENICGISPKVKFKSLGVLFSTVDTCVQENLEPKIRRMRDIMNMWKGRELSIKGRITLIKSLLASQFTYLASTMVFPSESITNIEKELGIFLWNGRAPKVRRTVICRPIDEGGLGAVNFSWYIRGIQLTWLRRMISGPEPKWRAILQGAVGEIELADLLGGNMDGPQVKKLGLPEFYYRIMTEYYRLKPACLVRSATEAKNQMLWFNKQIQISNNVVFFRNMYRQGIKYVGHLESNGELVSYSELQMLYPGIKVGWYRYQCLQQAIPREWRDVLRVNGRRESNQRRDYCIPLIVDVRDSEIELARMTCTDFYHSQLPRDEEPACRTKWAADHFDFSALKWKEICRLPYEVSTSTKLQSLQYRIMNRYVPTQKFLYDRKIVQSAQCLYCTHPDNIYHFLYGCCKTLDFWKDMIQQTNQKIGSRLRLSPELVIFGQRRAGKLANYLLLIARQYVMNKKLYGEPLSTFGFWAKARKQYEVDHCSAKHATGKLESFRRKWGKMFSTA